LPQLDGLSFHNAGTSQSFSWVNGKRSATLQFTYAIVASKVGNFTIAPVRFTTGGKVYTADPVVLGVVKSSSYLPAPSADEEAAAGEAGEEPIFIRAHVDRDTVYVNQQVTWTLGFHTDGRVDLMRSPEYSAPSAEGFWAEDLPPQKNYYKVLNGRKYLVNEIKRALFPTVPGEHRVGAARVDIVVDDYSMRSFDDFFKRRRGVFGFGKSTTLTSDEIVITVLPLPKVGRPTNFSGLVGRGLEMALTTDKQVVQVGDPINVILEITGEGNFNAMAAPQLPELPGFKMYESGSKSDLFKQDYIVSGRKKTDFVLIPKNEGDIMIEPIRMSYFDPVDRAYKKIASAPVHIEVKPGIREEGGRQVIFAGSGENIEVLGRDINYIHPVPATLNVAGRRLYENRLFLALHTVPLFALAFSLAVERRRRRWRSDVRLARASRAARDAEKKIKDAQALEKSGKFNEVFTLVAAALRDYFADKMNRSGSGLTFEDIEEFLAGKGVAEADVDQLRALIRTCDAAQYSASSIDSEQARETRGSAMEIVRHFEKRYMR
jgi:hypothetical protein